MNRTGSTLAVVIIFVVGFAVPVHSADVEIRPFEFVTRGRIVDNNFVLQTYGDVGLTLRSGFLARPSVTFGLESDSFDDPSDIQPNIRSVSVEVREFLGSEFALSYFLGEFDSLGSGSEFPARFGTDPVATQFKGFLYFPEEPRYKGMHAVKGTGLSLQSNDTWNTGELRVYVYQDDRFAPGVYSIDFSTLFDFDTVQLETFAGGTWPVDDFGRYRAGLLAHLLANEGDSLLIQVALPSIEPGTGQEISVDDFFFLFEPRVSIGPVGATLTFFWQPKIYNHEETDRGGSVDTNLKLQIGDVRRGSVAGGLESRLGLQPESDEQLSITTTPFFQFDTGGVIWDLRTKFTLVPFSPAELFEGYLGVRTEL